MCNTPFFSLAGSRFDLVLVLGGLITKMMEAGMRYRPRIQRQGTSVRGIRFGGVSVLDFKFMIPMGYGLAQLGASCKLEVEKSHFPFAMLTNTSFLRRAELPADAADWASDLNPAASVDQEAVDEMRSFFSREGMTSVGQFLEYYLSADVVRGAR